MSVIEKALELAQVISESDELLGLRNAEENLIKDSYAFNLYTTFNEALDEYLVLKGKKVNTDESSEMAKKQFLALNREVHRNQHIKDYLDRKNQMEELLATINGLLSNAVNESEKYQIEKKAESSSGGGCGSSGGCGTSGGCGSGGCGTK